MAEIILGTVFMILSIFIFNFLDLILKRLGVNVNNILICLLEVVITFIIIFSSIILLA